MWKFSINGSIGPNDIVCCVKAKMGNRWKRSTQEQTEEDISTPNKQDTTKTPTEKAQQNLLKCHLQYGHMPFGILVQAAQQGILPKNIITKEYPKCPSCLYGKSTRQRGQSRRDIVRGITDHLPVPTFPCR